MKSWPVHLARARFGALMDACLRDGPQRVTRRGSKAVVLVAAETWEQAPPPAPKRSLKALLMAAEGRGDLDIPVRGSRHRRPLPD